MGYNFDATWNTRKMILYIINAYVAQMTWTAPGKPVVSGLMSNEGASKISEMSYSLPPKTNVLMRPIPIYYRTMKQESNTGNMFLAQACKEHVFNFLGVLYYKMNVSNLLLLQQNWESLCHQRLLKNIEGKLGGTLSVETLNHHKTLTCEENRSLIGLVPLISWLGWLLF